MVHAWHKGTSLWHASTALRAAWAGSQTEAVQGPKRCFPTVPVKTWPQPVWNWWPHAAGQEGVRSGIQEAALLPQRIEAEANGWWKELQSREFSWISPWCEDQGFVYLYIREPASTTGRSKNSCLKFLLESSVGRFGLTYVLKHVKYGSLWEKRHFLRLIFFSTQKVRWTRSYDFELVNFHHVEEWA